MRAAAHIWRSGRPLPTTPIVRRRKKASLDRRQFRRQLVSDMANADGPCSPHKKRSLDLPSILSRASSSPHRPMRVQSRHGKLVPVALSLCLSAPTAEAAHRNDNGFRPALPAGQVPAPGRPTPSNTDLSGSRPNPTCRVMRDPCSPETGRRTFAPFSKAAGSS